MNVNRIIFFLGILLALFLHQVNAQVVTVNQGVEHQKITGFGGMNFPRWIDDLNQDQAEKALGNAPGQIGLSMLRVSISPNSSQFQLEIPAALIAQKYGAMVFATPWSPPAEMKSNNNTTGGELLPQHYGAYADHLLGFVSFMKDKGVNVQAVSLQNEPDITVSYESCFWSPQQMINFLKEQGAKFGSTKLIVAESFNFNKSKTDPILNDAAAERYVSIIGGHIYGGGISDYPLARTKGKEVWMTEHYTESQNSGNEWPLALDVGTEITNCMKVNFNAYIWWYIRRFYGFIDDEGNITKRGYVMSHFSKFIRPGATRVQTTLSSAPNVDATAYKTDTSLVVVVVNKNSSGVSLMFDLQNTKVDKLTRFTTSASKSMVNDGTTSISGGTFFATVDGSSITTFTSFAGNAGKQGNVAPVSNPGPELKIESGSTGKVKVTLDGSASTDPDGTIVNYSWSMNNKQLAWGMKPEVEIPIGSHTIYLTVTDNDGARSTSSVKATVGSSNSTHIWLEAECGVVGSNWNTITLQSVVSNNKYIETKPGIQSVSAANEGPAYLAVYRFEVQERGDYIVWARVNTPSYDDDSFWIKMDNGAWTMWNGIRANGSTWFWDDVGEPEAIVYSLVPGQHTLSICMREDGAGLDKIYITNTGSRPNDIGPAAGNCSTGNNDLLTVSSTPAKVYPNPARSDFQIVSEQPFSMLTMFSADGRKVLQHEYVAPTSDAVVNIQLKPGIYMVKIDHQRWSEVVKVFVE